MEFLCAEVMRAAKKPFDVAVRSNIAEEAGVDVPMPTLPKVSIQTRSRFFVMKIRGCELVVPNLEVVVVLELPDRLQ